MSRPCRQRGCPKLTSGFSTYCNRHKSRNRRHGHPDQPTITRALLKPQLEAVRQRIKDNLESKLWSICDQRWQIMVTEANGDLAKRWHKPTRTAANELARLASVATPRAVLETVLAMYLLHYQHPRLFRSEAAFRTQMVRRVRSLASHNFKQAYGAADGRRRRVLSEPTPRVVAILAGWLVELFGPAGVRLAQMEKRDAQREQEERNAFHSALAALHSSAAQQPDHAI